MSKVFTILRKSPKLFTKKYFILPKRYISGFTYLLPDIPKDTSETNFLLNLPKNEEVINILKITPNLTFNAFLKSLIELETYIEVINSFTKDEIQKLTFDEFYKPIDERICQLNYTLSIFNIMIIYEPIKYKLRKSGLINCLQHYEEIMNKLFYNETIFEIMSKFYFEIDKLNCYQKNIIEKYILNARLNGLDSKHKVYILFLKEIIKNSEKQFISNLNHAINSYKHKLADIEFAKNCPSYLNLVDDKGKININLSEPIVNYFLSNCNYSLERQRIWEDNNKKASIINKIDKSNNIVIDEIIISRQKMAKQLGFNNYIEYTLQTRTIDSITFIKDFLEKLFEKSRNTYERDVNELIMFSRTKKEYLSERFNLWDLPYFLKLCKSNDLNKQPNVNLYFTLNNVRNGLFEFLNKYLNINIIKDDHFEKNNIFYQDVQFYKMYYKNKLYGSFFLNFFAEICEPQFNIVNDRSDFYEVKPCASIHFNLQKSNDKDNAILTFHQVANLFRFFGYLVDHLINLNPYAESSGINSRSLDTLNLTANLFIYFFINEYDIVKKLTSHNLNKNQISEEDYVFLKKNLLKFESINLTNKIYYSLLDVALYSHKGYWYDIQKAIWNKYMAPFSFGTNNYHLCSALDLICGKKAGAYYSDLYSEVLAANIYKNSKINNKTTSNFFQNYISQMLLNEDNLNEKNLIEKLLGNKFTPEIYLDLLEI